MAWLKPSRSRPGQRRGSADDSGVVGGSAPLAGGPAALGVGDTEGEQQQGAGAPRDECHHWPLTITASPAAGGTAAGGFSK